ncbi:hypothetical protein RND81_06G042400 [Saponaria officinalis]|uniref:Protein LHY n=1 Tax=Saponaria officinalis TaxID=3572 RepID=A0AAW1K6X2_SAPOF
MLRSSFQRFMLSLTHKAEETLTFQHWSIQLEKEAIIKGVPIGQAIDIEIPPPRPKKKPSNPYPRKTGAVCSPNAQVRAKDGNQIPSCSSHSSIQMADLEKEPQPEKHAADDVEQNTKGTCGSDKCSEAFTLFQEAPSPLRTPSRESPASVTEAVRQLSDLEFVPVTKPLINEERSESHVDDGPTKPDSVEMAQDDSKNKMNAAKSFPRHAPVQILDGCQGTCSQGLSSDVSYEEPRVQMEITGHPGFYSNPAVSGAVESQNSASRSNNHQIYPSFHPSFCHLPNNQEDFASYLQMSSTFSSLIVSALLQNPAAHAAASFAASLWPTPNVGNLPNCIPGNNGGFVPRQMHPAPSMAAIAAATVAAATAWWAAHGLLPPLSAPFHSGFSYPSASVPATFGNVGQSSAANEEKDDSKFQFPDSQVHQPGNDLSEALHPENSACKKSTGLSSSSGNSGEKKDTGVGGPTDASEVPSTNEQKGKTKKLVDRSSCGSNTPSGSDAETDALGKNDKGNEESKEPDVNTFTNEFNGRRFRVTGTVPDKKEVSDEGRLAFRALFSRGRLPQSFSPPPNSIINDQQITNGVEDRGQNAERINNETSQLDLNSCAWESISGYHGTEEILSIGRDNVNNNDGKTTIGFSQGNLASNRTGFKPYKRCSVEARENSMTNSSNSEQGNCSKRLRVEGETSI